jgi:hypothetical protein
VSALLKTNIDTLKDTITIPKFNKQDTLHVLPTIIVSDSLYQKPSSFLKITNEELINTVGTANDLNRVLVTFPGVVSLGTINDNALVVRGGCSQENSYNIDGIEVNTINHFYTLDRTGGTVGFINPDLIQSVDFYTKNIPVIMPPKISSAIDIKLKNVKLQKPVYQCDLNISGVGLLSMGATKNNTFSYLVNGRWNDLRFLEKFITIGGIPCFGDGLVKLCYNISESHTLNTIGVVSYDFLRAVPFWDDNPESKVHQKELVQSAVGISSIINKNVIQNHAVIFFYKLHDNYFEEERNLLNYYHYHGKIFSGNNKREILGFKNLLSFLFSNKNKITLGFNNLFYHYFTRHQQWYHDRDTNVNAIRISGFTEGILKSSFCVLRIGLRGDYYTLITDYGISPRVEFSFPTQKSGLFLIYTNISYQMPVDIDKKLWTFLISPDNIPYRLRDFRLQSCNQVGFGYEKHIKNFSLIKIDTYCKLYNQEYAFITPWRKDYVDYEQTLNGVKQYRLKNPQGERRAFGMEISLQKEKKNQIDYNFNVSLSLVENKYTNGRWYNDEHDIPVSFKSKFGILMGESHLFAIGVFYSIGRPFYEMQNNTGGVYYNKRFKPSFLLNFRYSFNHQFTHARVNAYIELMNILNQRHIIYKDWDLEYKLNGFLPIGGIRVEF